MFRERLRPLVPALALFAGYAAVFALGGTTAPQGYLPPALAAVAGGAAVAPVAQRLDASRRRQFIVWAVAAGLGLGGVVLEGAVFAPGLVPLAGVPVMLLAQAAVALVLAGATAVAYGSPAVDPPLVTDHRRLARALGVGTVAYLVLFVLLSGLTYRFLTGRFIRAGAELVTPDTVTVLAVETLRGAVVSVSVVPLAATRTATRRRIAATCGTVAFAFSGAVPLLLQVGTLPPVFVAATAVDVLVEAGTAGGLVGWVLSERRT